MALLNEEMDGDLLRLWSLLTELAEQTNSNRSMMVALQQQATQAKSQAIHNGTGFALRRFNTDLSQEVFESELERMNASLIIENQNLLQENKQLNAMLKEYEQTLDTVMAKFRAQAHAAQQHELDLTRHYETLLLARESSSLNNDLLLSSSQSESLARLAHYVRSTIRSLAGEDPESPSASDESPSHPIHDHNNANTTTDSTAPEGYREGGYSGSPPPLEDWALEREIEITRLEKENDELRGLLGIGQDEELMKESFLSSGSWNGSVMSIAPRENDDGGEGSPSGSRSSSPALQKLTQGMPIRRGLLSQNRARMMAGGASGDRPSPGPGSGGIGAPIPNRPGSGMGMGGIGMGVGMNEAQVGPFIAAAPPGQQGGGMGQGQGQGQQQWTGGNNDPSQRKLPMGSYFKEFPT